MLNKTIFTFEPYLFGRAGFGGGVSGASKTDSEECEARTPVVSLLPSPVKRDLSFGVRGISANGNTLLSK